MKVTRKSLLKLAAASAVSTISFLYPGLRSVARAEPQHAGTLSDQPGSSSSVRMDGPDPSFATGEVVSKTLNGVVISSAAGARAIRLPAGTLVWKEVVLSAAVIKIGDWLHVKGTPLDDGSLLARSEWVFVNIGRRSGTVVAASATGLTITHNKGTERLQLSAALEVIHASSGAAIPGGLSALPIGAHVGAVGLRLPDGGFRATRIWT